MTIKLINLLYRTSLSLKLQRQRQRQNGFRISKRYNAVKRNLTKYRRLNGRMVTPARGVNLVSRLSTVNTTAETVVEYLTAYVATNC